ncbi:MAG: VCBS repeat-containing protein, partial [Anaerolineae bacterium]
GSGKVWSQVGVHVDHNVDLRGYANCGTEHRPNFANSAPAIADVDSNGTPEIIVVGDVYNCGIGDPEGDLYHLPWILKLDRTRWIGSGFDWTVIPAPNPNPGSGPLSQDYNVIENNVTNAVVADLDGDGLKEILYPSYDGRLHAYWLDKTAHGNWPYKVPGSGIRFASEPIVVDLDNTGDGHAEVIFTSWPQKSSNSVGQLHILDYLGNQLYAVNLPAPKSGTWNGGLGAPTIANIDTDAEMELVIGTVASGVVAYDLPGTANARILWGTGRGSFKRTGVSPIDDPFALSNTPSARAIEAGNITTYAFKVKANDNFAGTVSLNVTNPSPANLTLNLTPSSVTPAGSVTLTVTDLHVSNPVPGLFYNLPIVATGGGVTRTVTVSLLVGGNKVYLPVVLK